MSFAKKIKKMKDKKMNVRKDFRGADKKGDLGEFWKNKTERFNTVSINQINKPLFQSRRGARELQALCYSENRDSLVILKENVTNPKNFTDIITGYIYLNFTRNDSKRFRKIVAMHEASHLSITPSPDQLSNEDAEFMLKYPKLMNVLEDCRVNRYLTIKYPGMGRYFREEFVKTDSDFIGVAIGDLIQMEPTIDDKTHEVIVTMDQYKDEIRDCVTYEDVMAVGRKMVEELDQDGKGEGEDGDDDCDEEDGDGQGGCNSAQDLEDGLDNVSDDDRTKRLFDTDDDPRRTSRHQPDTVSKIEIIKKDKDFFLGKEEKTTTTRLSKNLTKLLTVEPTGARRTREGKLGKFDPIKFYTDKSIFKRVSYKRTVPTAYIVLDGSGSMWQESRYWQKSLTQSLVKLFKDIGVDYKIFIHSGDTGKFYYSEINDTDIPKTSAYCYTLDGSMLEALFEYEVDIRKKGVVFYFSDGQIPAQYPSVQVPLVEKYNRIAEMNNIPIFGVGLDSTGVEMFKHWYIVKDKKDFSRILERIGKKLQIYM